MKIKVNSITPNPEQPRRDFDPDGLQVLAESIQEHGLLQPILVEELEEGRYQLIAGERRWRAHQLLGWPEIEAMVQGGMNGNGANERALMAFAENLVRSDLNVIEEALGIRRMLESGLSTKDVAEKLHLAESSVKLRLYILDFEPEIQELYAKGRIPLAYDILSILQKLEPEQRLIIGRSAGRKKLTSMVIKRLCTRLIKYGGLTTSHRSPRGTFEKKEQWSALAQLQYEHNLVHELYPKVVAKTCQACVLFDEASKSTCKECPIVVFLWNLSKSEEL